MTRGGGDDHCLMERPPTTITSGSAAADDAPDAPPGVSAAGCAGSAVGCCPTAELATALAPAGVGEEVGSDGGATVAVGAPAPLPAGDDAGGSDSGSAAGAKGLAMPPQPAKSSRAMPATSRVVNSPVRLSRFIIVATLWQMRGWIRQPTPGPAPAASIPQTGRMGIAGVRHLAR